MKIIRLLAGLLLLSVAGMGQKVVIKSSPVAINADSVKNGTTNKAYTAAEQAKLAGVATGATANSTDAALRDRSTHTNTQAISTVAGLQTSLDSKYDSATTKLRIRDSLNIIRAAVASAGAINTSFEDITYASTLSVPYNSSRPNKSVTISGNLNLSVTGTSSGASGLFVIQRGAGNEAITTNGAFQGTTAFPTGSGAILSLSYVHEPSGIKWYCNNCLVNDLYLKSLAGYVDSTNKTLTPNGAGSFQWATVSGGATNAAPTASSVTLVGSPVQGQNLSTTYTYADAESNTEGSSVKKYYSYTNTSGAGSALLSTTSTYTLTSSEVGKYIRSSVTPVATSGTTTGAETFSGYSAIVTAPAPGDTYLDFAYARLGAATITEDPAHTFTANGGWAVDSRALTASGYIQMDYLGSSTASDQNIIRFGLDTDNNLENSDDAPGWAFYFYISGGTLQPVYSSGGANANGTSFSVASANRIRITRTGTTVKIEGLNSGGTVVGSYTYPTTSSASLYPKVRWALGGTKIVNALINQ